MPLLISDEILSDLNMNEREARIEIACRLFDIGKLDLWPAAKLAGLARAEFEGELHQRRIPVYRPTLKDLADDVETIDRIQREG